MLVRVYEIFTTCVDLFCFRLNYGIYDIAFGDIT